VGAAPHFSTPGVKATDFSRFCAHLQPLHVSRFDPKVPHFSREDPRDGELEVPTSFNAALSHTLDMVTAEFALAFGNPKGLNSDFQSLASGRLPSTVHRLN
jgi:hypothetical protein